MPTEQVTVIPWAALAPVCCCYKPYTTAFLPRSHFLPIPVLDLMRAHDGFRILCPVRSLNVRCKSVAKKKMLPSLTIVLIALFFDTKHLFCHQRWVFLSFCCRCWHQFKMHFQEKSDLKWIFICSCHRKNGYVLINRLPSVNSRLFLFEHRVLDQFK